MTRHQSSPIWFANKATAFFDAMNAAAARDVRADRGIRPADAAGPRSQRRVAVAALASLALLMVAGWMV